MNKFTTLSIMSIFMCLIIIILHMNDKNNKIITGVEEVSKAIIDNYIDRDNHLQKQIDTNKALLKQLLKYTVPDDNCLKESYPEIEFPDVKLLCINDSWAVVDVSGERNK